MRALTTKVHGLTENGSYGFTRRRLLTVLPTYFWDKGVFLGKSEVGVGPTPLLQVSRQVHKTRWLKSDQVTLWHVKQQGTCGTSTTYEESTPRYLLRPNYFIMRTKDYIIYTHYGSSLRWRQKQARRWKRRQQQRQRRRRELEFNLQKAHQPQQPKIFDSTLGYPGEGPGNVQERRTGTPRQASKRNGTGCLSRMKREPVPGAGLRTVSGPIDPFGRTWDGNLPTGTGLTVGPWISLGQTHGMHVYHTGSQQQRGGSCRQLSTQHPQPPSLFDSTLGYPGEGPGSTGPSEGSLSDVRQMDDVVTQGHHNHRGRYHKKKKYWDRVSESMWRSRDREGVWKRYMRSNRHDLAIPHWCVQRMEKIHPGLDFSRAREEWVKKHPKTRRTYRGGRQARERRDANATLHSCRGPHNAVPHAAEESQTATPNATVTRDHTNQTVECVIGNDDIDVTYNVSGSLTMNVEAQDATRLRAVDVHNSEDRALRAMAGLEQGVQVLSPQGDIVSQGNPRRRLWRNRSKLKEKRQKAKTRRKSRGVDRMTKIKPKCRRNGTPVLSLSGSEGESRMSFTHRIKVEGVRGHVLTEMKMVYVNVRTMRESRKVGKTGKLLRRGTKNNWKIPSLKRMMQKHGIYITALSETRRSTMELDVGEGYVLLTSQNIKVPWRGGVGLLLSPSAVEAWRAAGSTTWYPKVDSGASGRYLEITLATAVKSEGTFTVASLYGPTMQTALEHRESFFGVLRDRVLAPRSFRGTTVERDGRPNRRLPSRQFLIMMGDMNARVGKLTREDEGNTKVLGAHNMSPVNSNGSLLLEMATACKMSVANTFFKHKQCHTTTWMNAATRIPRVIDHALVRQWSMRHVVDVRAAPELSGYMDTDHVPCVITLRGNPRRTARARAKGTRWRGPKLPTRVKRLDVTALTAAQFKKSDVGEIQNEVTMVVEKMETKLRNMEVKNMLNFDLALRQTAEEVFEPTPKNPTWTQKDRKAISAACDERAVAAAQLTHVSTGNRDRLLRRWKQSDRSLRRLTRTAMQDHLHSICMEAADSTDGGRKLPQHFFRHVGRVKRYLGCRERPAKLLLRDPRRRIKEQDEWFKKRFNINNWATMNEQEILSIPPLDVPGVDAMFNAPDKDETLKAVMALRNGRSPDIVGVQSEVLKAAVQSRVVLDLLFSMILDIWKGKDPFPKHWLESIGCTIWKGKAPKDDLDNWRMVNIIAITSKVMSKLIHWRLQRLAAATWSHTQYGFRKDSWTMDAVFIVKRIMEAFRTTRNVRRGSRFELYNRTLYLMFEDFTKAFDSVPRDLLWKELEKIYGVPRPFVELLRKFHDGFKTYTVINGMYGEGFLTTSGVRQGCITGPDLWNFHFQVIMWAVARRMQRRARMPHGIPIDCYLDGRLKVRSECVGITPWRGDVKDVTFADDSVLIAHGIRQTCVFQDFEGAARAGGLTMSQTDPESGKPGKTKVMRITGGTTGWRPRDVNEERICAGGQPLPFVEEFVHLGSVQSTDRDLGTKADINRRLKKAISAHAALEGMWRSKHISYMSKGQLTAAITIPTALYGCENWVLTRTNIRRLERFWNRITRWTYGVRTHKFQDLGMRHTQIRKKLGLQEIMTYVRRRVLRQIGHLVRKPIEDPSKQLLLGHVADRVTVKQTRTGGGRGRQTQPPKLIQRYYRNVLDEQIAPGFDMRIWFLLAQDRNWWRKFAQQATHTTGFAGSGVQSLATRAREVRRQRRVQQGHITTEVNEDGEVEEWEICPLRCGFKGRPTQIAKHIAEKHPLHPVQHYCSACNFPEDATGRVRKSVVKAHIETGHEEGLSRIKVRHLPQYVYRWDHKAGYLRTYPPGTLPHDRRAKPFPEGWLVQSERRTTNSESSISMDGENVSDAVTNVHSGEPTCEGIEPWNGDSEQEAQERAVKREAILRGRQLSDLNERELRNWMRTKSYTRSDDGCMGWGRKGKLARYKTPRRQRVGRSDGCKMRCGWDDHINYTKFSCPLHPNYNGDKPKVRGDTDEAILWKANKHRVDQLKARRIRELHERKTLPCRRGCGKLFHTRKQREAHMRNCTVDGIIGLEYT